MKKPPLIAIVGETASGKSALSMSLAQQFDGEIICADSWTVYKGFDIGTAKPSKEDQATIPHHLIDVAMGDEGFNVERFKEMAVNAIDDISNRSKLPIMVGGSGLYVDSVLFDYQFLGPPNVELRSELNSLSLEKLKELVKNGNLNSAGVDMKNKRRVIRLIEGGHSTPKTWTIRSNTLVLGLKTPLDVLEKRIRSRVEGMVESGFVEEVKSLGELYGWDSEVMKAPGYKAFREYVNGSISLEEATDRFVHRDLRLAKKQRTWFKRNNSIQWITKQSEAVALVTTFLNK